MKGKKRLIGIITAIFGLSLVSLFSAQANTRTKANDTNYTFCLLKKHQTSAKRTMI